MTTDRELLELAARAAGLYASDDISDCWCEDHKNEDGFDAYPRQGFWILGGVWNPLTDDGDALRLAVKLNIDLVFGGGYISTQSGKHGGIIELGDDPLAATRKAIVRAAAEIGRMKCS